MNPKKWLFVAQINYLFISVSAQIPLNITDSFPVVKWAKKWFSQIGV